ncbi:CGNR zinc finger domain-containing protein [Streptomyces nogalater]
MGRRRPAPRRPPRRRRSGRRRALLLAEDATELLTGSDAAQLTECAAQGCARWFLRSHGARRWCTTKCGNRVRAARAYAARKAGSPQKHLP